MNLNKLFLGSFLFLSAINLIAVLAQWQNIIYLTKPLLMATLALWFFISTKNKSTTFSKLILAGILFSIAGDTFLMLPGATNPNFFLLGLGSFLITHIFYIIAFFKFPNPENGIIAKKKWLLLPILIYLVSFLIYLWNDIPSTFKVAVLIYGCTISTMLAFAINLRLRVTLSLSNYLILGTLLFVLSDSVIGINKFKSLPIAPNLISFTIMATYILGQYLIAKNCIKVNSELVAIDS